SDGIKLINGHPLSVEYQYLTAVSAYQVGDQFTAMKYIVKITGRSLGNHQIMNLAGLLLIKEGVYQNSLFFFKTRKQACT
ncbi:hypothetical protein VU05_02455, partial [Desulfobulbus sp. F1]|nr:hypothetical protein [Desulfobulbus sp. F1]